MKHKKLTVSIGTTAYNEENNIKNMLESVIGQKENTIKIKEIIVVSDGSSDATVKIVKKIKDKRIKIIDDKKRLGKPSRVAQLLKTFKGDAFVIIDSDMVMRDKNTLEKIVRPFIKNRAIGLVCGNVLPLPATSFLESAINNYRLIRESLEDEFEFGKTAYAAHAFLAYSKKFARALPIPKNILNEDAFSYFFATTRGYETQYVREAIGLYRSPQTVKDHINQATRHLIGGLQLHDYFGRELVENGFRIPKAILIKIMLMQLIGNPLGYIFLKILNIYCFYQSRKKKGELDVKWDSVTTSKNLATRY